MNEEITLDLNWNTENLYEDFTKEQADEIYNNLIHKTTFTITDNYSWEEHREYLESRYQCMVASDEGEDLPKSNTTKEWLEKYSNLEKMMEHASYGKIKKNLDNEMAPSMTTKNQKNPYYKE